MPLTRRAFLASPALFGTPPASPAAPTWMHEGDMPIARSEFSAVAIGSIIVMGGGFGAGADVRSLDTATGDWSQLPDLPYPTNHAGFHVLGDDLIVCGGYTMDGTSAHDTVATLAPKADHWALEKALPRAMGAFGIAHWEDDLFIAGGATEQLGGPPQEAVWRRSRTLPTWESCPPLSTAREHLPLIAVEGRLYAVGGRAAGQDELRIGAIAEVWDRSADSWQRLPDLPTPRSGLAGCSVPGGLVVAGGERSTGIVAAVDYFDVARGQWSALPDLPHPVHGAGLCWVDGVLHILGGSTVAGQAVSSVEVWALQIA